MTATYALVTRATPAELAAALPVPSRVGMLDGWTVAGLDPALITTSWPDTTPDQVTAAVTHPVIAVYDGGSIAGLAASRAGDSEPRMFTEGWLPPKGKMARWAFERGWRSSADAFVKRSGLPVQGGALAAVCQPAPDGTSFPVATLIDQALAVLGLPPEVHGTSLFQTAHLEGVIEVGGR